MALQTCACTLSVKDITGTAYSTAELVAEPRKSQVNSGEAVFIAKPKRVAASAGVCSMTLAETTTSGTKVVFTLNWNDGTNYSSVIFDPIQIPNQTSVDLSTLLTVSRG